jgi:uncharacterized membrane protein
VSTLPSLRFGALFDKSWSAINNNLPLIAALTFVYFTATVVMNRVPGVGIIFSGLLSPGYLICLLKLKDKKDISMQDFFWSFTDLNRLLQVVILKLVTWFLIIAGLLLLVFPGIYVTVAISLASTYFVIRKQDALESIKASFRMVQGRWWSIFGLIIMLGLLNIAGVICLVIGLLVTIPMSTLIVVYAIEELEGTLIEQTPITPSEMPETNSSLTPSGLIE